MVKKIFCGRGYRERFYVWLMEVGRLDFAEDGVVIFGDEGHGEPPLLGDGGLFVTVDVFDDVVDGGDAADDEW